MSGKGKIMTESELKDALSMVIDDLDDDDKITVWNILFEDHHLFLMDNFNEVFSDYTPLEMMDIEHYNFNSLDRYFWFNSYEEIVSGDISYIFDKDIVINEISKNIHQPYLKHFAEYDGLKKLNELVNQYLSEEKL